MEGMVNVLVVLSAVVDVHYGVPGHATIIDKRCPAIVDDVVSRPYNMC